MFKPKIIIPIITVLAVILFIEVFILLRYNYLSEDLVVVTKSDPFEYTRNDDEAEINEISQAEDVQTKTAMEEEPEVVAIPRVFKHEVPFTAEAPHADWNRIFNDACEEASIIMYDHYRTGDKLNKDIATEEILDLVDWENEVFGFFEDTSIAQTAEMLKSFYGYETSIVRGDDVTIDALKYNLFQNGPVIVPMAGRLLKNKYFSGQGPLYHMIIVVGYNDDGFLTNDPGTKRGAEYFYSYDTFMRAIHDLPKSGKDDILKGEPAFMVIK